MFGNVYKNKKIIVTGDTGFKGAWLSIWLHSLGAKVTGIANGIPTEPSLFKELELDKKIDHRTADIRNLEKMKKIFKEVKPDFVFHLAAQAIVLVSYDNPITTFQTNVMGTANILESLRSLKNECKAVIITSDKCYDNVEQIAGYKETDTLGGKDPYSGSKGAAELVIKSYYHSFFKNPDSKIKLVSTRAGNVVGGGDWAVGRIIPDCMRAWSKGEKVKIRHPESTRPWQHVLEPLSGYLRAGQALEETDEINGEPFNFGPNANQIHTVIELLTKIAEHWEFKHKDDPFFIEPDNSFHEASILALDCTKAKEILKWQPVLTFEETVNLTGDWYNNFYNKKVDMFSYTTRQIEEYVGKAKEKKLAWI